MKPEDGATQSVKNGPIVVEGSPIKIVVLGNKGSGKSDFIYRHVLMESGNSYELELMDLSNIQISPDVEEYPNAIGYIVVYSVVDRSSFGVAQKMLLKLRQNEADKIVVLFGNKADLQHLRQVGTNEGRELAIRFGCAFHEISAADCDYQEIKTIFNEFFQLCIRSSSSAKCVAESRNRKRPVLNVSKMFPNFKRTDVPQMVERRCRSVANSLPDLASTLKDVFKKKSV